MTNLRSLVCVITLVLLPPAPEILAQPEEQPVRQAPAWPTPQEYFDQKNRTGDTPAPAAQPAAEVPVSSVAALPPFAVQLAAFRDHISAQAFAGEVTADKVMILGSARGGQDWYVVILGFYATQRSAAAAEAEYRQRYPSATTWLRGTGGLRHLEDPGG